MTVRAVRNQPPSFQQDLSTRPSGQVGVDKSTWLILCFCNECKFIRGHNLEAVRNRTDVPYSHRNQLK